MAFKKRGYCPFRIATQDYQPGCVLQMGKDKLCYSKEIFPLLFKDHCYYCPLLPKVILTEDAYQEIEKLVNSVIKIQDNEETCINLWPMVSGIAKMKNNATTTEGKQIKRLSKKLKEMLQEMILNQV